MGDIIDVLRLVGQMIGKLASNDKRQRAEVATHCRNLSATFNAFPTAARARNFDEMNRLEAKTEGLLASLRSNKPFTKVLGDATAQQFFDLIRAVSNAKTLASENTSSDAIRVIVQAAGYFEGYAATLAAEPQD